MGEESPSQEIFQDRLRAARKIRGMEQSQLAAKAGLPAASISHFEAGKRKPSFDNLRRLARAIDVTTDYLLGNVEDVGLGAEGQALYRNVEKLTGSDRTLAEGFMRLLASKGRADPKDTE